MNSHIDDLHSIRLITIMNGVLSWGLWRNMLFMIEGFFIIDWALSPASLMDSWFLNFFPQNILRLFKFSNPLRLHQTTHNVFLIFLRLINFLILLLPNLMSLLASWQFVYLFIVLLKVIFYIEKMLSRLPSCLILRIAKPLYQILRLT